MKNQYDLQTLNGAAMTTKCLAICFLTLFVSSPLLSQSDSTINIRIGDNEPAYLGPLVTRFPILSQRPPLSSDMPFDVLIGYIIADSVARYTTSSDVDNYLSNATSRDTLKYAAKYQYILTDYDPVLYNQWLGRVPRGTYQCALGYTNDELIRKVSKYYEDTKLISLLLYSDFIAHVKVNYVDEFIDSSAAWAMHANVVTSEIVESIKGSMIPFCIDESFGKVTTLNYKQAAIPGACLLFDYRDEWYRESEINPQKNLANWVTEGQEYIVFLRLSPISGSSSDSIFVNSNSYVLSPTGIGFTTTGCMYPIHEGVVEDFNDDFGFGTQLSTEVWKSKLRLAISNIVNAN